MLHDYLVQESNLNQLTFQTNAPLAPHTSFGIGGQADYLVSPQCEDALVRLVTFLRDTKNRFVVLGNGTNLLFDDKGFRGVVILTHGLRDVTLTDTIIDASCGASLIAVSHLAAKNSLTGLAFACGIPGTVGGAVYMNAGAHGGEIADVVLSSRYLDTTGRICEITEHDFSYRHSIYQENEGIILSCRLGLSYGVKDEILAHMKENKQKREATQPIKEKSGGSVFRRSGGMIPAALIDKAGLKGLRIGGAAVSEKHAGFIVNKGGATANDVLMLIEEIQKEIMLRFGEELIPEIRYIKEQ